MSDFRVKNAKFRNVPIAVTPEGFWCCPSPAALQKTLKNPNLQKPHKKEKTPSQRSQNLENLQIDPSNPRNPQNPQINPSNSQTYPSNSQTYPSNPQNPQINPSNSQNLQTDLPIVDPNPESQPKKISVGFGQSETSDLKVILYGKENLAVKMSVHKEILAVNSEFFEEKLGSLRADSQNCCVELFECEDVEIYVETIGLMYCKDVKNRLVKQNVARVLRILKVAESLSFNSCIKSCIDYLSSVPWISEEEEQNVISSIKNLQIRKNTPQSPNNYASSPYHTSPLLKRVSSETLTPLNETLNQIMHMVLNSSDDRARREMKTLVLKLLKENNIQNPSFCTNESTDFCLETLYSSCQVCLDSLLDSFKQASGSNFAERPLEGREIIFKKINLEADNLLWLVDILSDRNNCEDFVSIWSNQNELAKLHENLPIISRHVASRVTARLFIGIGKGEMLPNKEVKLRLLNVWLKPLMEDYNWLKNGIRSFDGKVLEEGIGRTILTLDLEDQKGILMNWLGAFLEGGKSCPDLGRAFEVWWRRTFVRPYLSNN
ncbi:hypothetical protein LUZ60_005003 [Juncus effusus]|nr:hypothetical protein LUZ60_005003 [Juncus effusus]